MPADFPDDAGKVGKACAAAAEFQRYRGREETSLLQILIVLRDEATVPIHLRSPFGKAYAE